jgi:hypothetical protein
VAGSGGDPSAIIHSVVVNFTAMPSQGFDFTLGTTPASASAAAGQPALFSLDVSPSTGTFPAGVSLSCSKLPALTTCSFNPPQVGSGSSDSVITFTLATTAPTTASARVMLSVFFSALPLVGFLRFNNRGGRVKSGRLPLLASLAVLLVGCLSCGAVCKEAALAAAAAQELLLGLITSQSLPPAVQLCTLLKSRCPSPLE